MSKARDGAGLLDRDVDAAEPRVVHAHVGDEVAAGVGDGDVHGLTDLGGLLLRAAITRCASASRSMRAS